MRGIAQTQSFRDLIDSNYIYIDKTEQIFNLLQDRRVFISRPRRFGKSLMLDAIGTLFEEGVEPYFRNTWIHDRWTDDKYPVLVLNFLGFSYTDYKTFCADFDDSISEFASLNGIEYDSQERPLRSMKSLLRSLRLKRKKIVILMDEYDAQLAANINNPELYEMFRIAMRELYGVMKGDPSIRFLGITGVTRLKDVSIFSVGSDIKDMSYYSPVSTIIGFTREELRKYYIDYINLAVSLSNGISVEQVTETQRDELLDKLSEEYDGYCFDDEYVNKVYSTWSVNSFFRDVASRKKVKFDDYWYESGGVPSILARYLETHIIRLGDYAEDIYIDNDYFQNPTSLLNMKQEVLMCQTGYLTTRSPVPDGGAVRLGVPNNEVRRSLTKLLSKKLFHNVNLSKIINERFFSEESAEKIVTKLNSLMNTISYEDYKKLTEKTIQGILQAFMIGADQPVLTEVQSAEGRADLVLEYEHRRIVFELKYAETEADCEKKLQEAIEQIKSRRYGDTLPAKSVLKLALVFNGNRKVRKFTHYSEVI